MHEIFKQIPDTGTGADYDLAKEKLKAHFDQKKNRQYEVYCFQQAMQESHDTLDQFHTRLQTMADYGKPNWTKVYREVQAIVENCIQYMSVR